MKLLLAMGLYLCAIAMLFVFAVCIGLALAARGAYRAGPRILSFVSPLT